MMWRVYGDGALMVQSPDGTQQWVSDPFFQADRATMLPNGDVVGSAYYKYDSQIPRKAMLWRDGQMTRLKSRGFAGHDLSASDTNASGALVGSAWSPDTFYQAVSWRSLTARPRLLPTAQQYAYSSAESIDPDGTVYVKTSKVIGGPTVWLAWKGDRIRTLQFPARFIALAVSGGGAAGYVTRRDGSQRPAFYGSAGLSVLSVPDGATGKATRVTSRGEWGGFVRDAAGQLQWFVGESTQGVRYLPVGPIIDVRSFGNVTAVTASAIVRCIYP